MYSYGIVLWEIIFRNKPWTGKHSMKIIQAVVDGSRPSLHNMPFDTPEFVSLSSLLLSLSLFIFGMLILIDFLKDKVVNGEMLGTKGRV